MPISSHLRLASIRFSCCHWSCALISQVLFSIFTSRVVHTRQRLAQGSSTGKPQLSQTEETAGSSSSTRQRQTLQSVSSIGSWHNLQAIRHLLEPLRAVRPECHQGSALAGA